MTRDELREILRTEGPDGLDQLRWKLEQQRHALVAKYADSSPLELLGYEDVQQVDAALADIREVFMQDDTQW